MAPMHFIASLEHSADNCWAREEKEGLWHDWLERLDQRAAEHGVEVQGPYVAPNEHTFYFLLEAEDFAAVSGLLGPPLLQDHDGHVTPVLAREAVEEAVFGAEPE